MRLSILACIIFGLYVIYLYFKIEPQRKSSVILGIDVSRHQRDIEWSEVAKDGISFAYIKATEGSDLRDRYFRKNWRGAKRAGIVRGAYHFFRFCRSGLVQARNFIATVPVDPESLPPAIDLEFSGNCRRRYPRARLIREIKVFIARVRRVYKKRPILYVSPRFYRAFSKTDLMRNNPLWVSSIFKVPNYAKDRWIIWQFHHNGTSKGIRGPVDLNVFRGKDIRELVSR